MPTEEPSSHAPAPTSPPRPPTAPPTGIRVLIVGAGFAGLTAAIECARQGHTVLLLEKAAELRALGDIISFGSNAGRIFGRWPGVPAQMEPISLRPASFTIKSGRDGDVLFDQRWTDVENGWGPRYDGHRGEYHDIVYRHALSYERVEVRLGARVEDYFEEDGDGGEVGVVLADGGERITADVVLAAEGVRSRGRKIVLGFEDKPKASGYAVYRSWFPADEIAKDPDLRWLVDSGDRHVAWLAPDIHFIAASLRQGQDFSWVCTHKDDQDIEESWQHESPLSDAREVLRGWEPAIQKILDVTPSPLIDWKLVYRDPLPTWISPGRRIALIGDAAHPFLPTSMQGASQAMEDGVTLGVCLRRAAEAAATATGDDSSKKNQNLKDRIREAVAAYEALRYERVRSAQKTGEQTRDIWHKADLAAARRDPPSLRLRREAWLLDFDAERHAEDNYDRTVALLRRTGLADTAEARALHLVPEAKNGWTEYAEDSGVDV
ncbi:hypothetical protein SLS62_004095 [Diatrype stigma]|uniref:FAD-binding domain-containing protein n=1 Tax=Diatrype stigma TaxID=117547 RepID=A0AAN9YQW6_9PEZI